MFDVTRARQSGATDDQIIDYLSTSRKYDWKGALNAGADKNQVIDYLSKTESPTIDEKTKQLVDPIVQKQPNALQRFGGALLKGVVLDPAKALLVKPAIRVGQAVGQVGLEAAAALSDNPEIAKARDRGRENIGKDTQTPVGNIEGVKAFGEGGGKQIVGEGIEAGADIASLATGGGTAKSILAPKTILTGAAKGALKGAASGATYGALHGVSKGLQDNKSGGDIALQGAKEGAIGGIFGGVIGGVSGAIAGGLRGRALRKAELQDLVDNGEIGNKKLAEFNPETLKKDPIAVEAAKQGVKDSDIAVIKTMSPADKQKAIQMLDLTIARGNNKKILERPLDIVGKTTLAPVKVVSDTLKKASMELDTVASGLKGQTVDKLDDVVASVNDDLSGIGATTGPEGVDFTGSSLEGVGSSESVINNVYKRIQNAKDAADLHNIKRYIDNNVDYGSSSGGLGGEAESILKGWRHTIDGALDTQFPEYNRVNTVLSENIGQMNNLYQILGKKFRVNDPLSEIKAGTVAAKILSNSQNRGDVLRTLNGLQETARKYGYTGSDDVINQVLFADSLEEMFGTNAERGLQGTTERAIEQATGVTKDLSRGNIVGAGIKAIGQNINKIRGIDDEGKIKALRALLSASADTAGSAGAAGAAASSAAPNMQAGFVKNAFAYTPREITGNVAPAAAAQSATLADNVGGLGRDISDSVIKKTLGMQDMYDLAIKSGDMPVSSLYKDPQSKILVPTMATHVIDDVAADLTGGFQKHHPEIIAMINKIIDPNNTTFQQIADAAQKVRQALQK